MFYQRSLQTEGAYVQGLEEKVLAKMSSSKASSVLPVMTDFTFIIWDLELLNTDVLFKRTRRKVKNKLKKITKHYPPPKKNGQKKSYRRARGSQFKQYQIEGSQAIGWLDNYRQVISLPWLSFKDSRMHILLLWTFVRSL